jgi:hypothetical protein
LTAKKKSTSNLRPHMLNKSSEGSKLLIDAALKVISKKGRS